MKTKSKTEAKKLTLHKQTLRVLTSTELSGVAGGLLLRTNPTTACPTYYCQASSGCTSTV